MSAVEGMELIISEASTTLLLVTITKSTGTVRAYGTIFSWGSSFGDDFHY
jgi:hypothetical protein